MLSSQSSRSYYYLFPEPPFQIKVPFRQVSFSPRGNMFSPSFFPDRAITYPLPRPANTTSFTPPTVSVRRFLLTPLDHAEGTEASTLPSAISPLSPLTELTPCNVSTRLGQPPFNLWAARLRLLWRAFPLVTSRPEERRFFSQARGCCPLPRGCFIFIRGIVEVFLYAQGSLEFPIPTNS